MLAIQLDLLVQRFCFSTFWFKLRRRHVPPLRHPQVRVHLRAHEQPKGQVRVHLLAHEEAAGALPPAPVCRRARTTERNMHRRTHHRTHRRTHGSRAYRKAHRRTHTAEQIAGLTAEHTEHLAEHIAEHEAERTEHAAEQKAERAHCRTHTCACVAEHTTAAFFLRRKPSVGPSRPLGPRSWAGAVTKARAQSTKARAAKAARAGGTSRAASAARAAKGDKAREPARMEACPLRRNRLRDALGAAVSWRAGGGWCHSRTIES